MKHPKNYKMFFHITDISNLEEILIHKLQSRRSLKQSSSSFSDIADVEILELRNKSNLDEYVPFHFIPNSPFAGKIQIDNPDKNFIYICLFKSYVESYLHRNDFKILPYHPLYNNSNNLTIYDYDIGIEKIDWDLMNKRDYSDENCKQVCMAELLSLKPIMIDGTHISIYVKDNHTKNEVLKILQEYGKYDIHVNIQKEWFVKSKNDS